MKAISVLSDETIDVGSDAVLTALSKSDKAEDVDLVYTVHWDEVETKADYLDRCSRLWDAATTKIHEVKDESIPAEWYRDLAKQRDRLVSDAIAQAHKIVGLQQELVKMGTLYWEEKQKKNELPIGS